ALHDERSAAAGLLALPRPMALTAAPDGDVLDVRATAPVSEAEGWSWGFSGIDVRDPDGATTLAWTAGRGLRVSHRMLAVAESTFRLKNAGFIGADGPFPHVAEMLGLAPEELDGVEWVLLAGRPRPPGSPPGGTAPLRRVSMAPDLA
ncbi:MAG TPA: hypothetical protein VF771_05085, partial [Longimicrobiaceae bacterium]